MADGAFLAWCDQHGICSHHVVPGYVPEGWRGIIATDAIESDSITMTVPEQLLMSVLSARKDLQLAAVLDRHQLSSHQVLCIHLLHEASKGPASFWHPYIRQLPQQYTTLLNWPSAAIQALQLQYAQEAAAAAVTKARSDWASARPALQALSVAKKWLSWRAWCWSSSCVLSRTMYHPDDPPTGCLTPLADLHNYQPPAAPHEVTLLQTAQQLIAGGQQNPGDADTEHQVQPRQASCAHRRQDNTTSVVVPAMTADINEDGKKLGETLKYAASDADESCSGLIASSQDAQVQENDVKDSSSSTSSLCGDGFFDSKERVYKILARKRYQAGDQVFLCYGRHSNLDLLDLYGFLLDNNPHDTSLLPISILTDCMQQLVQHRHRQQQGEGRQWKRQQQQQQQPLTLSLDVCAADCWVSTSGTPSWQLMLALRQSAATSWELRQTGHWAHEGLPISLSSEQMAIQCLEDTCQHVLQILETSVEQDRLLLQQYMRRIDSASAADEAIVEDSCSCRGATDKGQTKQQAQQSEQQVEESDLLAVRWRSGYKASLNKCVQQCRAAKALLAMAKCSTSAGLPLEVELAELHCNLKDAKYEPGLLLAATDECCCEQRCRYLQQLAD